MATFSQLGRTVDRLIPPTSELGIKAKIRWARAKADLSELVRRN